MLAQKSCKLQEKWPQSYKNLQESYKHWLARLLASLAAMQDINLACKNLTRVMQDFYRNLARCKRDVTTILHAHGLLLWKPVAPPTSFSLRLFYTIIRSHTHYNKNYYYSTNNCAFVVTDNIMFIIIIIIIIVDNQVASVYQKILVGFKVLVLQISYLNNNINITR